MEPTKTDKAKKQTGKMTSFVEGETIKGKFLRVKETEIRDRITGNIKTIRVYKILLADGSTASISSRTMLDDAFDDVCALGGGWEALVGKQITFERGEDIISTDENSDEEKRMGTYSVRVG